MSVKGEGISPGNVLQDSREQEPETHLEREIREGVRRVPALPAMKPFPPTKWGDKQETRNQGND